jgi:hypothetical protein
MGGWGVMPDAPPPEQAANTAADAPRRASLRMPGRKTLPSDKRKTPLEKQGSVEPDEAH